MSEERKRERERDRKKRKIYNRTTENARNSYRPPPRSIKRQKKVNRVYALVCRSGIITWVNHRSTKYQCERKTIKLHFILTLCWVFLDDSGGTVSFFLSLARFIFDSLNCLVNRTRPSHLHPHPQNPTETNLSPDSYSQLWRCRRRRRRNENCCFSLSGVVINDVMVLSTRQIMFRGSTYVILSDKSRIR